MTYAVIENCINCKFQDWVDVCPVGCFYEGDSFLVIHPDECIDCGVCEPECPADAIRPDTEPGLDAWLAINTKYAELWLNITEIGTVPSNADDWNWKPGKAVLLAEGDSPLEPHAQKPVYPAGAPLEDGGTGIYEVDGARVPFPKTCEGAQTVALTPRESRDGSGYEIDGLRIDTRDDEFSRVPGGSERKDRHMTHIDAAPQQFPDSQTVLSVRHWDDRLFSFRVTRPRNLRFRSGEFVMIGLPETSGKPILRAYSIASPFWDEELEFYSIKVQDGPLTSRLQRIAPGDRVIVKTRSTGTLVLDALLPGKRLWMISTGTGVAPFASLMREPETYSKFDRVILTQTCRQRSELAYGEDLAEGLPGDPLVGDEVAGRFVRYATTTRERSQRMGRITTLIETGELFCDLGVSGFDPAVDRMMICGSMGLNLDMKKILDDRGFFEGANSRPGQYVVERAFVD